jgi:HEAT repeat protein
MNPEQLPATELVALLATDAELLTKARACRQLAINGGAEAIPALAALLGDDRLSDYARTALEGIPAPAAGEALRKALPTLKGRLQVGVIQSLAVRREAAAVPDLIALMKVPDREFDPDVLFALGKIASNAAVEFLVTRQIAATSSYPPPLARAILLAVDALLRDGKREAAIGLLDSLEEKPLSAPDSQAMSLLRKRAQRVVLFDGKSLTGWKGDSAWFRVADGAIVAGSLEKPIPQNEFLSTTREFGDFELCLSVRLHAGKGNGGIQLRSQRVPNSREMAGYQADMAVDYWGGLYDESRRAKFLGTRTDVAAIKGVLKPGDWNDYVIRCEGPRIRLWLNGLLTNDFTETDASIPRSGRIALQIHGGPPGEAHYINIQLTEL